MDICKNISVYLLDSNIGEIIELANEDTTDTVCVNTACLLSIYVYMQKFSCLKCKYKTLDAIAL